MTAAGAGRAALPGPRLGAGREADVYAWGGAAVLKLYRPGFGGHRAEAAALRSLDGVGIAPRLLDVVGRDARTGLVLQRFDGPDMLTLLQRRPWRVRGLADALATAHRAVHRVAAPAELPDLRQVLAARIRDADLPARLRAFATRMLDGLPDGIVCVTATTTPATSCSPPAGPRSSTGPVRRGVYRKPTTRARFCCCGGPARCPAHRRCRVR